jgi:cell division septal protein FtsQ
MTVVIIASLLIVKQIFAIKTVNVKSTTRSTDIQAAATKAIASNWWQDNLITFNSDTLAATLRNADPMISSITVHRKWPNGVKLDVTLKSPSIGWSSGNQAYIIDLDGTAIGTLPTGSTLPVVFDGSNLPVTIGQRVASTKFVTFIQQVTPALAASGVVVTQMQVKDTTLDLYVVTNKGYYLLLDTGRPVADTIGDLKQVLTALAAQKRTPVEYIDLRIPNKAYYK